MGVTIVPKKKGRPIVCTWSPMDSIIFEKEVKRLKKMRKKLENKK